MNLIRPRCFRCVYWSVDTASGNATVGHCHRYPPGVYVNPQSGTVVQKFPTTERNHWCGEWNDDDSKLQYAARQTIAAVAE